AFELKIGIRPDESVDDIIRRFLEHHFGHIKRQCVCRDWGREAERFASRLHRHYKGKMFVINTKKLNINITELRGKTFIVDYDSLNREFNHLQLLHIARYR